MDRLDPYISLHQDSAVPAEYWRDVYAFAHSTAPPTVFEASRADQCESLLDFFTNSSNYTDMDELPFTSCDSLASSVCSQVSRASQELARVVGGADDSAGARSSNNAFGASFSLAPPFFYSPSPVALLSPAPSGDGGCFCDDPNTPS